jgi:hypothetical protein
MLDAVLVMLVTTSILGPVLTQRYAPRMRGLAGVGSATGAGSMGANPSGPGQARP